MRHYSECGFRLQRTVARVVRATPFGVAAWLACLMILGNVAEVRGQARPGSQQPIRTEFGFDPEDDTPLVEREPFDRITVSDQDKQYTFAVKPLGLEGPINYTKSGYLRFELLDRAGQILQVPWGMVTKIERFEELIVAETHDAYQNGDFDKAFRNLIYLFDRHGKDEPVVKELLEQFWYRDGQQLSQGGNHALATTVWEELYFRNPGYRVGEKPLPDLLAEEYDRRMRAMAESGDVDQVIAELNSLKRKFSNPPPAIAGVLARWNDEVVRQGQKFVDRVEEVTRGNDPIQAHEMARRTVNKLPNEQRSWTIYGNVFDRFPMVIVGVTDFALQPDIRAADNWSARRSGSLLQQQLVDLRGLGEDGGQYEFADGRIESTDQFGLSYRLEILPPRRPGQQEMTALDLANRLGALIREGSQEFYFPLAKIVDTIAIANATSVDIRLRQPVARFESLLRVPYQLERSDRGVYEIGEHSNDVQIFRPVGGPQSGLWTIVERRYASSALAADALLAGEIDVLDRVFPADLPRLQANSEVVVRPYVVPSIHVLIPNPRSRFMRDQSFRRGLLYGIDRARIVKQLICGGQELRGFIPISGPLPTGSDENDLIGYGYNDRVEIVPFNPGMAIVSPQVVIKQLRDNAREELKKTRQDELDGLEESEAYKKIEEWLDHDESINEPKLVLLHPATEIATTACQSIQQMLKSVGRNIELRALPPGVTRPTDDNYDLLYAEFTMEEPLVDLRLVLGELGLAKQVSPTIEQLLSELDVARNWVQARQVLRQIHDQCNADASILALWQTINYYAYRWNVKGLGESSVRLYDDVEHWTAERRTKE